MSREQPPPYSPGSTAYNPNGPKMPPYNPHVQQQHVQVPVYPTQVPMGFQAPQQQQVFVQPPGSSVVVAQQPTVAVAILPNTCPACRAGQLTNQFTCCGIFMAIIFFPLGLICCMMMTERRCNVCQASFG